MIQKRKRLNEKSMHSGKALPLRGWLFRALELLIAPFYKKPVPNNLTHLRQWEREKISHLGLATQASHHSRVPPSEIHFSSWSREKVTNFGLTKTHPSQKQLRKPIYPEKKPHHAEIKIATPPKKNPLRTKKIQPKSAVFQPNVAMDDFFKILGYE